MQHRGGLVVAQENNKKLKEVIAGIDEQGKWTYTHKN